MNLIYEKWDEILEYMRTDLELSNLSFNTWIKPLKIHSLENNILRILVEVDGAVEYLEKKYKIALQAAIIEIIDQMYEIEFVTKQQAESEELPIKKSANLMNEVIERANLNPKYTFDTFVVGSNNKFAHAASLAVADKPGKIYNPLFLYGGVGLGKTHLMHSIAHSILSKDKTKKVLYVTSETFTVELIDAIRGINNTTINDFREKYRNIDVLLIDDVQFIIGKESTQEEFFHTFNTLYDANKQIIISSDRLPNEIPKLEERLRTRFSMGLTTDIQPPDYETRIAILRKKAQADNLQIPDDVFDYIAEHIHSNIRELEGVLVRLSAFSNLSHRNIDLNLTKECLQGLITPNEPVIITGELILKKVAEYYKIRVEDFTSKKRTKQIAYPRQIAMYLCREMTNLSLPKIGELFGGRDHSTVIHACEKIADELRTDQTLQVTVNKIKSSLTANS